MRELIYKDEAYKAIDNCICDSCYRISPADAKMNIRHLVSDANEVDKLQGDTVSRRYLLAEIDDLSDEFSEVDENGLHSERWCGILDAKGVIANAPFVADRPKGAWIFRGDGKAICSDCGKSYDWDSEAQYYNYCPECGTEVRSK